MRIGVGARAPGMGDAFVSVADDADAVHYNPAGLALLSRPMGTTSYVNIFEDASRFWMAYAMPLGTGRKQAVGFGFLRQYMGGFDAYDSQNNFLGTFDHEQMEFRLAYGQSLGRYKKAAWGAALKYISERFTVKATGWGLDVGAMYKPTENLTLGLTIRDATRTKLKWSNAADENVPTSARLGVSYTTSIKTQRKGGKNRVTASDKGESDARLGLTFEIEKIEGVEVITHLGAELGIRDMVFFRLGLDDGELTAGAGIKKNGIRADYSYMSSETDEAVNRIGLMVEM